MSSISYAERLSQLMVLGREPTVDGKEGQIFDTVHDEDALGAFFKQYGVQGDQFKLLSSVVEKCHSTAVDIIASQVSKSVFDNNKSGPTPMTIALGLIHNGEQHSKIASKQESKEGANRTKTENASDLAAKKKKRGLENVKVLIKHGATVPSNHERFTSLSKEAQDEIIEYAKKANQVKEDDTSTMATVIEYVWQSVQGIGNYLTRT